MEEVLKPIELEITTHEISMIRQAIENRRHPLDMVREQISNMCATEVGAENIKISYYIDPKYEHHLFLRMMDVGWISHRI